MTLEEKNSYLLRRDGVLEVLASLKGHWDLAEGFSALLQSEYVTPGLIDNIENLLKEAISTAKDERSKEKIKVWLARIEEMKIQEMNERVSEQLMLETTTLQNIII